MNTDNLTPPQLPLLKTGKAFVRAVANFLEFRQALAADPDPGMAALGPERILTLRDTLLQHPQPIL